MRVLHLTSSFPRWRGDTSGLFVAATAAALTDAGVDVAVLAPHAAGAATAEVVDGLRVRRFRYGPDRLERLAYGGGLPANARTPVGAAMVVPFVAAFARAARRAVAELRPDVVHAHWWLPSGLVALGAGVPTVITVHGSDARLAAVPGLDRIARTVLGRATAVAAVSESLQQQLAGLGVSAEVVRMPASPFRPEGWHAPSGPPWRVVAVGRLTPEKGFDVLVEAAALAGEVSVDLVGGGPESPRLVALAAARGVELRAHGPLLPSAIGGLLDGAAAVVVPSRREGLGIVAVEALASGCPVIASRVGGLPEVVADPDDGLLVPPDDPAALAAALRQLPLGPPVGVAAARHAPAVVAAAHLALYERVSAR